ncbi:MAG: UvrD-helicase domain-containing protein [Legionellales bacterium]|jgi:superfamily I DNA/RNA helicase
MKNNKLIIAAAGSGKTTYLIEEALKIIDNNILITTFTEANEAEIRSKVVKTNNFTPPNITIQTWFSFLLQHGVRPYQGLFYDRTIKGIHLPNGQSAPRIPERDVKNHYFDRQDRIYSDKISKFIIKCHDTSGGKVIDRLSRIYSHIFIDEVQDLAGHDLELLKLLFSSNINTLLVADPRQGTYSTNNSNKNKKYSKSGISIFFEFIPNLEKDHVLLTTNYRSVPSVCNLSNTLYPNYPQTKSGNMHITNHDGIFIVRQKDLEYYLYMYQPIQLRYDRRTMIQNGYQVMNFGESKGLSFDRVLIYPTKPIVQWLKNRDHHLEETSRAKLYVAITRAKHSVAFVYDFKDDEVIKDMTKYNPN